MTQPVLPTTAFAGGVPSNLSCGFCGRPVQKQFYRAVNRFACGDCAAQVNAAIEKNTVGPTAFAVATAAGLVTGLAGGAVWATVVHVTNINIGIVAAFIGVAVGKTIHFVSGRRRSVWLQWLSAILAMIGVAAGDLMIACWQVVDDLRANGLDVTAQSVLQQLQDNAKLLFHPLDLAWIGIAAYAAWRLCKPHQISIAGPYAYEPSAGSLQFDTVEPLHELPPGTPPGNP